MIALEAAVVALVAGAAGAVVGVAVAGWSRDRFVGIGAMPANLPLRVTALPVVGAVFVTVLGARVAAGVAARRAARIPPTEALVEAGVERRRLGVVRAVAGMISLAAFGAVLVTLSGLHENAASSPVTTLCVVLAAVAAGLFGPAITRAVTAVLRPAMAVVSPRLGAVAAANSRASSTRLTSVLVPLSLGVAMVSITVLAPAAVSHVAGQQRRAGTTADAVVVADGPGVPRAVATAARDLAGVSAVTEERQATVRLGQDSYVADALTPATLARSIDPDVTAGTLSGFGEDSVALAETTAAHHHADVGDTVRVTLGDGVPADLTVSAVYADRLGYGGLIVPFDIMAAHTDMPFASAVFVHGVAPGRLARHLAGWGAVRVVTMDDYLDRVTGDRPLSADVGYLAMSLIIGFIAIVIVNTLVMATADRARDFAALRLSGMTCRQVRRMVRLRDRRHRDRRHRARRRHRDRRLGQPRRRHDPRRPGLSSAAHARHHRRRTARARRGRVRDRGARRPAS